MRLLLAWARGERWCRVCHTYHQPPVDGRTEMSKYEAMTVLAILVLCCWVAAWVTWTAVPLGSVMIGSVSLVPIMAIWDVWRGNL